MRVLLLERKLPPLLQLQKVRKGLRRGAEKPFKWDSDRNWVIIRRFAGLVGVESAQHCPSHNLYVERREPAILGCIPRIETLCRMSRPSNCSLSSNLVTSKVVRL